MGNPRQRRRARSSRHRPVSQSSNAKRNLKKMPPIRGPKVIQEAWNKNKTVKQNYAELGLAHTPGAPTKYTEAPGSEAGAPNGTEIPPGFGRIIRDTDGNVLRVELPAEEEREENNNSRMRITATEKQWIDHHGRIGTKSDKLGKSDITQALEKLSGLTTGGSRTLSVPLSGVGTRHTSVGERRYLNRLVESYGTNVERMARDRKLNPEQRTAGQLRRALRMASMDLQ